MAINTGGYGVNVLPQYTPVDANLAAFNPAAAMQGAAQGIDMVTGLQKLKDMRQIHEENAKMSAAKNKLLQAQAEQSALTADYMAKVQQQKLDAEMSRLEHDAKKNRLASGLLGKKSAIEEGELNLKGALQPGAARLAMSGQGAQEKASPFLNDALVFGAQTSAGTAKAALGRLSDVTAAEDAKALAARTVAQGDVSRLAVTEDTKDVAAKIALSTALESEDLLPEQQALIRQKLSDDIANARTDAEVKRAQAKASLDGEIAKTKNLLAQAENYKAMASGEGKYSKLDEHAKKMMDGVNRISMAQTQIMKTPVVLPNNKGVGTLAQYLAATREGGVEDGAAKRSGIPFITRADVQRNPDAERYIQDYKMLRDQKTALQASWMKLDPLADEPTNSLTAIPKEAIEILMQRPDTAALFDKQFGPGSASHFLKR